MGNFIHRWFVALGIFTLVFTAGNAHLHAQGMRMMPSQNQVRAAPSNMGSQLPGMGFGNNTLSGSYSGFGSMMNGRNYSSGANGNGSMGYGGGGYGGSGNASYGSNSGSYTSIPSYQYENPSLGIGGSSRYSNRISNDPDSSVVFKAMGLPVERGQLAWPIGLQALRPDEEVKTLRVQIDGLLQLAASDRMNGREDGRPVDLTKKALARLRFLLRTNGKDRFFPSTYRDSARFLDQVESGLKVLQ